MHVRDALTTDAEAIRRVHRASIEGLGPDAYSREQVDAWAVGCEDADYAASIEAEDTAFVVAEDDGIVGFGSVTLPSGEPTADDVAAEITGVYVHPSAARQGVGTSLYTELERRARRRGVHTLVLSASLNAVGFYEAHGFERVAKHDHEFSSHEETGVTGTVVEMRKAW